MQPWNVTAEYKLQYLAKWKAMPSSITVPGFPGQTWVDNNTWIAYGAPATDTSTQFVFHYWTINSVTYNQGNTTIPLLVCGPIDGTAYYANETKLSMTPDSVYKTSPNDGYCTKFNVTITASNFDANRLVGGQPMDIYGFEFRIQWDTSLLEVTNVYLNLDAFFAPNSYFIAKNEIGAGYYLIAATVKGNYTGFSGTKPVFTLTFHVIRDACYNQVRKLDLLPVYSTVEPSRQWYMARTRLLQLLVPDNGTTTNVGDKERSGLHQRSNSEQERSNVIFRR
jgi:hypothetical protein